MMFRDNVNRTLDRKRNKLSTHQEEIQQVRTDINDLERERLKIRSDLQQRTKLEESMADLSSTLDTLDREIQVCMYLPFPVYTYHSPSILNIPHPHLPFPIYT